MAHDAESEPSGDITTRELLSSNSQSTASESRQPCFAWRPSEIYSRG